MCLHLTELYYCKKKIIVIFQENIISRRLTTKTSVNGIFYMVVEEVEHYFDVCSGQLIVTCVVGKTTIPIHQESFNRCTSKYYVYRYTLKWYFFVTVVCYTLENTKGLVNGLGLWWLTPFSTIFQLYRADQFY